MISSLFPISRQKGIALLILMAIIAIGALSLFVSVLNSSLSKIQNQIKTAQALAEAKDALLGFALGYDKTHSMTPPGYLPCPDTDGDGSADPPCGAKGVSYLGRLPWRTLGLEQLRGGGGECLWYAVSGAYKDNPKSLNSDSAGAFEVKDKGGNFVPDVDASNKAIAVIFAAGKRLGGQNRGVDELSDRTLCGSKENDDEASKPANYLETLNGINNAQIATTGQAIMAPQTLDANGNVIFNDSLIVITQKDFTKMNFPYRMEKWVADQVLKCLHDYADSPTLMPNNSTPLKNRYPWPDKIIPVGVPYPDYIGDGNTLFGRIPYLSGAFDKTVNLPDGNPNMPNAWKNNCFTGDWNSWWPDWREMVFYAIEKDNSPTANVSGITQKLKFTAGGGDKTVIVLIAGKTLTGQNRSNKSIVSNYLEGENKPKNTAEESDLNTNRDFEPNPAGGNDVVVAE